MSPSVVLTAEQPGNSSAVVRMGAAIATVINGREKCILLSALLAGKIPRYLSSPETEDQCTAVTATPQSGAEPASRKASTKGRGWPRKCHPLSLVAQLHDVLFPRSTKEAIVTEHTAVTGRRLVCLYGLGNFVPEIFTCD